MIISRIYIENFRNFKKLDVNLSSHAVIVGENKIGKSNLLHALRLILDPSLPDSARHLRIEDFWDGLNTLAKDDRVIISIDLAQYEDSEDLMAVLAEHLISAEPMISRLTYVFQPLPDLEIEPQNESDYEFFVYGGDAPERRIGYELRRRIPLDFLPALRDAENDLASWRRSPLKPLIDEAARNINMEELEVIAEKIFAVTNEIREIPDVKALSAQITDRLADMVGASHAVEMMLGFSPTEPERLLRALRLFIDGGKRGIAEASLGSANLLYLILKCLELERLTEQKSRDHTFLAIEEPEAHLHPHVQRLVYKDFLRSHLHPPEVEEKNRNRTIFLTTHSPYIISVSPIGSFIVLRKTKDGKSSEAVSTANLELDEKDKEDLERYIDVTRGEILFAKGVLLVEGDAEKFILPILSKLNEYDFDELGISVCSVSGTNFLPYIKLLGPNAIDMPFAVVTDFDPSEDGTGLGEDRIIKLLSEMMQYEEFKKQDRVKLLKMAPKFGLFLGEYTLEIDLFKHGQYESICKTLLQLGDSGAIQKRAKGWLKEPHSIDEIQIIKDITSIGKGRFAQRVAANMTSSDCPEYIKKAIKYVADKCR
jgi:putative ATP-dependent endonuclease of OLD family